ncbi:portal protein [Pseudomonas aeruginosa]|uniref:portal protein n=1 Tax=Pseudomonas aeruginosa TaxID=287 RepID=UPI003857AC49
MIVNGLKKPETEEEQQWLIEAQQAAQSNQDPMMVAAQAEQKKAEAELVNAQNRMAETQIKAFTFHHVCICQHHDGDKLAYLSSSSIFLRLERWSYISKCFVLASDIIANNHFTFAEI